MTDSEFQKLKRQAEIQRLVKAWSDVRDEIERAGTDPSLAGTVAGLLIVAGAIQKNTEAVRSVSSAVHATGEPSDY